MHLLVWAHCKIGWPTRLACQPGRCQLPGLVHRRTCGSHSQPTHQKLRRLASALRGSVGTPATLPLLEGRRTGSRLGRSSEDGGRSQIPLNTLCIAIALFACSVLAAARSGLREAGGAGSEARCTCDPASCPAHPSGSYSLGTPSEVSSFFTSWMAAITFSTRLAPRPPPRPCASPSAGGGASAMGAGGGGAWDWWAAALQQCGHFWRALVPTFHLRPCSLGLLNPKGTGLAYGPLQAHSSPHPRQATLNCSPGVIRVLAVHAT